MFASRFVSIFQPIPLRWFPAQKGDWYFGIRTTIRPIWLCIPEFWVFRLENYGKSFPRPEPEQPNNPTAGGDEIPVIEENYPLPQAELTSNSPKETPFEGDAADEIDVRDIPF